MFLVLNNLTKIYDNNNGVFNLNLSVNKGELISLLGPSGCGKTTTLNMIGGFIKPTSGSIILDEQDITFLPPEKRPISTVFQSYALFPHMNVIENVTYGLKYKGYYKKSQQIEMALQILNNLGLIGYERKHISELSGGQQQRVAIARSLILNPKVLLLDEPFSNLDASLRVKMRDELKEIQKKFNITMIFVTHDQEEAMEISDRIVVMEKGKIIQIGTPEDIYFNPLNEFVAKFIGKSNIIIENGRKILVRPENIKLIKKVNGKYRIISKKFLGSHILYKVEYENSIIQTMVKSVDEQNFSIDDKVELEFLMVKYL